MARVPRPRAGAAAPRAPVAASLGPGWARGGAGAGGLSGGLVPSVAGRQVLRISVEAGSGESKPVIPNPSNAQEGTLLCATCGGDGERRCPECDDNCQNLPGIEERFGGRYKVGELCWLCRGKRMLLCGDCSGAGFAQGSGFH